MKFKVFMTLDVDPEENVLSIDEEGQTECVQDLIETLIFDADGVEIKNIKVTSNE